MKNYLKTLTIFIMTTLVVVSMNYCNKSKNDLSVNDNDQGYQELIEKSNAMQEHILAFKTKMEYYRDNPGLKTLDKKYVLEAIQDWEATLNYEYCDSYISTNEIKEYDTLISLPVDGDFNMTLTDVSDKYYNAILAAIQTHYYVYNSFNYKKLLSIDLEPNEAYNAVHVTTTIGDALYNSHPPYDWKFGEWRGTCDDNHFGESDAAQETAKYVMTVMSEDPPGACYWYFSFIEEITAKPRDMEGGIYIYDNPNDNNPPDNYTDYLIYYAHSNVDPPGLSDDVRCVENSPELNFYKQSYKDLTLGWVNASGGKKYQMSVYAGKDHGDYLQHELKTKIGYRFVRSDLHGTLPIPD